MESSRKTTSTAKVSLPQKTKLAKGSLPAKFVLKREPLAPDKNEKLYKDGLALLKTKQDELITARRREKELATEELDKSPENHVKQDKFAIALSRSHVNSGDLINKLGKSFRVDGNVILYMNIPIAKLYDGDDSEAYVETAPAKGPGYSPIYKRVTLDGLSTKDYVSINGAMIRRQAYRGITPPENQQRRDGQELKPIKADRLNVETPGVNYKRDGSYDDRDSSKTTDVQFIKSLGVRGVNQFPADHKQLLAFTQIRNGVGKVLSATSTPKAITSNHGSSFGQFGTVTIDLAQVPMNNVLHHYNVEAYETGRVKAMIQQINEQSISKKFSKEELTKEKLLEIKTQAESTINEREIDSHVTRGNFSFVRNREILFTSLPFESITDYIPSQSKVAYETAYRQAFKVEVDRVKAWDKYSKVVDDPMVDLDTVIDEHLQRNISNYSSVVKRDDVHSDVLNYMNNLNRKISSKPAVFAKRGGKNGSK